MEQKAKRKHRNGIDVVRHEEKAQGPVGVRLSPTDRARLLKQAEVRRLRIGTMARLAIGAWLDQIEAA